MCILFVFAALTATIQQLQRFHEEQTHLSCVRKGDNAGGERRLLPHIKTFTNISVSESGSRTLVSPFCNKFLNISSCKIFNPIVLYSSFYQKESAKVEQRAEVVSTDTSAQFFKCDFTPG